MTTGFLFLGHGTRRDHGVQEFLSFYERVQSRLRRMVSIDVPSRYAFLEMREPSILSAADALVHLRVRRMVVIPLFLFEAGHMREDIPFALNRVKERHPDLSIHLEHAFGHDSAMLEVVYDRLAENVPWEKQLLAGTDVLLLGRGNNDEVAQQAFLDMVENIRRHLKLSRIFCGFLAGNGSSLEDTLHCASQSGSERLVIFPYLWFSGWLTDTLPDRVRVWQSHSNIEITIAPHLGTHVALVNAVACRAAEHLATPDGP